MRTTFTARKRLIQGLAHHETEGFNPRFPYQQKTGSWRIPHLPEYTIRFCAEYAIIYAFGWRAPALYLPFSAPHGPRHPHLPLRAARRHVLSLPHTLPQSRRNAYNSLPESTASSHPATAWRLGDIGEFALVASLIFVRTFARSTLTRCTSCFAC